MAKICNYQKQFKKEIKTLFITKLLRLIFTFDFTNFVWPLGATISLKTTGKWVPKLKFGLKEFAGFSKRVFKVNVSDLKLPKFEKQIALHIMRIVANTN